MLLCSDNSDPGIQTKIKNNEDYVTTYQSRLIIRDLSPLSITLLSSLSDLLEPSKLAHSIPT